MASLHLKSGRAPDIHVPWLLLAPYTPHRRVLVIGCESLFSVSGLAQKCESVCLYVFGLDCPELTRTEEILLDCSNVEIVKGENVHQLPFETASFDACVASSDIETSSNYEFFSEVYRILSPSGTLYFSASNTIYTQSPRALFGWHDDETWPGFKQALERVNKFGCRRYKKELTKQYSDVRCYSMSAGGGIDEIIEVEARGSANTRSVGFRKKFLHHVRDSGLFKAYFAREYGIYASKRADEINVIDKIVLRIAENLMSHVERKTGAISVTQKGTAVFMLVNCSTEKSYIVKIALGALSETQLQGNYESITAIHANRNVTESVKNIVPVPVCRSECDSYHYFVEEQVCGVPAVRFSSNKKLFAEIMKFTADIVQNLHLSTTHFPPDHAVRQRNYIRSRVNSVISILSEEQSNTLSVVGDLLLESLVDKDIPMVFHKGDCSVNNILVETDGSYKCNLIDWDQSNCSYFPFVDIVNLLESFRRHSDRTGMGSVLVNCYFKKQFSKIEASIIDRYLEGLGLSDEHVFPLTIMYWLDHVCAQNFFIIKNNERWMENNVYQVLDYFTGRLTRGTSVKEAVQ